MQLAHKRLVRSYLKTMDELHAHYRKAYGDDTNAAIARLILLGYAEDVPVNISFIADTLGRSRYTIRHRVLTMAEQGYLHLSRIGDRDKGSLLVTPSEDLVRMFNGTIVNWVQRLGRVVDVAKEEEGERNLLMKK